MLFFMAQMSAFPPYFGTFAAMLGVNQASLYFADRPIFDEISFILKKNDRVGLVGKNGAGKSTLLKAMAGLQKLDTGKVSFPQGYSIGYLPQDMDFLPGKTVWQEAESSFERSNQLKEEIDGINHQLASREDYESESYLSLLDDLAELNEKLNLMDVDSIEGKIEQVLMGLGFERSDFDRQSEEFSGGWRMRIELAKILLQNSDLLLLDEPTNHLDIESIQWLEGFLNDYPGEIVLISHDRAFLDNLTKRTVEIAMGQVYDYNAPYTKYLNLRKERREQQLAAYENQQKQIKQTEAFIERFRAKATKAVQVQSRIKQLERMERIEVEEEDTTAMRFSFPPAPHSGKINLRIDHAAKSYGDLQVFSNVDLLIERGEKVSFVGKNGEGKSTLSRLIVGEEKPSDGEIELGYQVKLGYYAQNQAETLDPKKTVFETIDESARGEVRKQIRTLLGSFLFQGDEVDKPVSVLSGGERARLALCKLLLEPINFLVLDEPTNHLDIRSKDILKDALLRYDGSMIIISHDRDFLKGLTDKLYEFSGGRIKEHLGGVEAFLRKKQAEDMRSWESEKGDQKSKNSQQKAKAEVSKSAGKSQNEIRELKKELKRESRRLEKLEGKIALLEKELSEINQKLKNTEELSQEENQKLVADWQSKDSDLQKAMKEWESQGESVDAIARQLE